MTSSVQVVADTHSFIWYLQGSARLSQAARAALDATTDANSFPTSRAGGAPQMRT